MDDRLPPTPGCTVCDPDGACGYCTVGRINEERRLGKPTRIRIRHKDYERVGSAWLSGQYATAIQKQGTNPKRLVIEVEQTDLSFRRKNNGPALIVCSEFAPWLLMDDILSLVRQHVEISFEVVEVESA